MPALVSAQAVENALRAILIQDGYDITGPRGHGENGPDIIATKQNRSIHIEAIAFKTSPPARSKDFYEAFFRAVSRLQLKPNVCAIALPQRFGAGLPQRAKAIGKAWQRIGKAFPELEIWLVDTEKQTCSKTTWKKWLS